LESAAVQASFDLSPADSFRAWKFRYRKQEMFARIGTALVLLLGIVWQLSRGSIGGVLVWLGVVAALWWWPQHYIKKIYSRNPQWYGPHELYVSDAGFTVKKPRSESRQGWEYFSAYEESDSDFILISGKNAFQVIPKRGLTEEQVVAVRALLARHIGPDRPSGTGRVTQVVIVVVAGLFAVVWTFNFVRGGMSDVSVSIAELRQEQIVGMRDYEGDFEFYVVWNAGRPLALSTQTLDAGDNVRFCPSSGMFESVDHGHKFDRLGFHYAGPALRGLDRYSVHIDGDDVVIDVSNKNPGPPRGAGPAQEPIGPFCYPEAT
jgi:hypothetical protein